MTRLIRGGNQQDLNDPNALFRHVKGVDAEARLANFLRDNPARLGEPSPLRKSIMVLAHPVGSRMTRVQKLMPMLDRTGSYPPSMPVPEMQKLGIPVTSDPEEQRLGCNFIDQKRTSLGVATTFVQAARAVARREFAEAERHLANYFSDELVAVRLLLIRLAEIVPPLERLIVKRAEMKEFGEEMKKLEEELQTQRKELSKLAQEIGKSLEVIRKGSLDRDVLIETIEALPPDAANAPDHLSLERRLVALRGALVEPIDSHRSLHEKSMPQHAREHSREIVMQGCGDVSMNEWNVAWHNEELIRVEGEPLSERSYTCLIGWKEPPPPVPKDTVANVIHCGLTDAPGVSIGRVRFSPFGDDSQKVMLLTKGDPISIRQQISYAIYGQALAWDGELKDPRDIIHEFSDLRHVIAMPNLNPKITRERFDELIKKCEEECRKANLSEHFSQDHLESLGKPGAARPLFGMLTRSDVWLGEYALLRDPQTSEAACVRGVSIPLTELGASLSWTTLCLLHAGFEAKNDREQVTLPGTFAWDLSSPTHPRLVLYFRRAVYPCTLVGVGNLNHAEGPGHLFLLAWGHRFDQDQKYSIFECAQILLDLGAKHVLLIDEGQDVFHLLANREDFLNPTKPLTEVVAPPLGRTRIRGTLAFWTLDR